MDTVALSLEQSIRNYYLKYYRDTCSIKDFEPLVAVRLKEEEKELSRINELQTALGFIIEKGQRHFILGTGTGGLAVVLKNQFDCEVFGAEPDRDALEIIKAKCRAHNIPTENFTADVGENLSFPSSSFDFIHVYSVIEHVQDVGKTLGELIRVLKPGGKIYLHCPNFRFPWEAHYKIPFPTFLPRFMGKLYLRARKKNPDFVDTLNFLSQRSLQKHLFQFSNINFLYFYRGKRRASGKALALWNFFIDRLGIYPYQEVLITKTS